ncbi:hypothetical protein DFJ74DRAFT_699423 [Hyaloraphidium curvatum]|nr:hypothetical protein DFJ74DRAFT_699423 [Hyaloraphidium curvatum]
MAPVANSTLLTVLIVDAGIQLVFYIHAALAKTEKFYDLSGALTYLSCMLVSLLVRPEGQTLDGIAGRQIMASVLMAVWCIRLGGFLFMRILRTKDDKRFDELKKDPIQFAIPWSLQIVWVFLTALNVWIVNGNNPAQMRGWWALDFVGLAVWCVGWGWEVIADHQKNAFKTLHPKDFISTGLFRFSRYPSYFGELVLWIGMWLICIGGYTDGWNWVGTVSPVFVFILLYFISGVRMLENSSEKRYGKREDYQRYKASTSKFIPWFPKKLPDDWKPTLLSDPEQAGQAAAAASSEATPVTAAS